MKRVMSLIIIMTFCFILSGCSQKERVYTISDINTYMRDDFRDETTPFADIKYVDEQGETKTISVFASKTEQDTTDGVFELPTIVKGKSYCFYPSTTFEKLSDNESDATITVIGIGNYSEFKVLIPEDTYNVMLDGFCNSIEYTQIYP